jgi:hypothetical protein
MSRCHPSFYSHRPSFPSPNHTHTQTHTHTHTRAHSNLQAYAAKHENRLYVAEKVIEKLETSWLDSSMSGYLHKLKSPEQVYDEVCVGGWALAQL